jgi:ATP-dependent Clp protease protease subunit
VIRIKHALNEMLAKHTGKSLEQIEKDTDRDYFMSAEEAMNYGLIDRVIEERAQAVAIAFSRTQVSTGCGSCGRVSQSFPR